MKDNIYPPLPDVAIDGLVKHIERLRADLAAEREANATNQAAIERFRQHESELRAQLDEAREALEPFADMLMSYDAPKRDWMLSECSPEIGALRRARAVLEKIKEGGDE